MMMVMMTKKKKKFSKRYQFFQWPRVWNIKKKAHVHFVAITFIGWPKQSFKPWQWFLLPVDLWTVPSCFHKLSLDMWVNTNVVATVLPWHLEPRYLMRYSLSPFYCRRHYLNSSRSHDSSPENRVQVLIVLWPNHTMVLFQDVFWRVHRGYT